MNRNLLMEVARMHRMPHPKVTLARLIGAQSEAEQARRKLGLYPKVRQTAGRFTEEDKQEAIRLFEEEDMPRSEVASLMGFHPTTIARHLPDHGWSVAKWSEHTASVREAEKRIRKRYGV